MSIPGDNVHVTIIDEYIVSYNISFYCIEYDDNGVATARPRRMSEVNTATKIQPIPEGSSFFLFSQTNRFFMLNNFHLICFNYTINIDHYNRKNA